MEMDTRSSAILQHIVEHFIADAQPVSSRTVASRLKRINASPATIRTIMAELENQGLLQQPHTSAGRVPTEQGLRAYLDTLKPRLRPSDRSQLDAAATTPDVADIPAMLGQSLAGLSGQMAVVAVPRFLGARIKEVGLLKQDERHLRAVFLSHGGLVQQKLVELDFDIDNEQLSHAQNFLNEQLEHCTVAELRQRIKKALDGHRSKIADLKEAGLEIAARVLPEPNAVADFELIVEGASHLVGQPEFADLDRLRDLLQAIEKRQALLELLTQVVDGYGVQVVLGSEHHVLDLPAVACVGVPCTSPDGHTAAVTVLGPSRMDYGRLVPLVNYAATLFDRYWENV